MATRRSRAALAGVASGWVLSPLMRTLLLAGVVLLSAGCSEPRPAPSARFADVMPNIPLPPESEVISREDAPDAIKLRFRSSATPEAVAEHYRNELSRGAWRLVSDAKTADGGIALYAETDGPSLWVTIRKADGAQGTFVDLAGARSK